MKINTTMNSHLNNREIKPIKSQRNPEKNRAKFDQKCNYWLSFPTIELKLRSDNVNSQNFTSKVVFACKIKDGGHEWMIRMSIGTFERFHSHLKSEFSPQFLPDFPSVACLYPLPFSPLFYSCIRLELEQLRAKYVEYLGGILADPQLCSHPLLKKLLRIDLRPHHRCSSPLFLDFPRPDTLVPEKVVLRNSTETSNLEVLKRNFYSNSQNDQQGSYFLMNLVQEIVSVKEPKPLLSVSFRLNEQNSLRNHEQRIEKVNLFILLREINDIVHYFYNISMRIEDNESFEDKMSVLEGDKAKMEASLYQLSIGKNTLSMIIQNSDECRCNTSLCNYLASCSLRISACIERYQKNESQIIEGIIRENSANNGISLDEAKIHKITYMERRAEDLVLEGIESLSCSKQIFERMMGKKEEFMNRLKKLMMEQTQPETLDRILAIRDYVKSNFDAIEINSNSINFSNLQFRHTAPCEDDLE
eukprot:TRINITY_DN4669_c0_g1_i1.p1 TRINITY_DN4669_c0_g1~~TRINITY_DN4669_c0_g1_i1.p1  ORF type:complete len:474 (+),score=131.37 TRINITY_DN4669_c0_g1_i1:191-1612(+)